MKNTMIGTYIRNDESYNFNFYTNLSAFDKLVFVNSVVDTLIDDDSYNSIIKDLIFDFNIIRVFTDIDTSFINVKDDDGNDVNPIIPIERFLEETNICDIVKVNMEVGLLDELNKAVNRSIEYRTGIHTNPLNEALTSLINTLEKKINEVDLDSVMGMVQKFSDMTGDITPDSIMNAYMESDVYKKNMAEIEDAKKRKAEFAKDMDKAIGLVGKK